MMIPWTAILGIIMAIWRWLVPTSKWETKRENTRKKLKEIDRELEQVTIELVEAKKNQHEVSAMGLDMCRERLLAQRADCKREYDYAERRCDKGR